MNATRRDLEIQFNRIVKDGWLPVFQKNAERAGTTTAHELGLGSRETNLKNIRGDFRDGQYHGFGPLQVDIGTDPEYARTWTVANWQRGVVKGTDIYIGKVNDTKNCVGKTVKARTRSFFAKAVEMDDLRRIATAAYNCGRWAHYHFSNGENVDSTTTGHDYSRDVYDRSIEFAELLEDGQFEENAVRVELRLQGKYARRSHLERFGIEPEVERVKLQHGGPQETSEELAKTDYERDSTEAGEDPAATSVSQDEMGILPEPALSIPDPSPPIDPSIASTKTTTATAVDPENKTVLQEQTTKVEDRPGTNASDPAVQVSQNGGIAKWLTGGGTATAIGGAVVSYLTGHIDGVAVCAICITLLILALVFRGAITDAIRMQTHADPNKYNVK